MKRRKSPYKHKVREHTRQNRPVVQYERGKGKQMFSPRRSRVIGGNPGDTFDMTFFYIGEPREEFPVEAKNYGDALSAGIEMRDKPLPPKVIKMRRQR